MHVNTILYSYKKKESLKKGEVALFDKAYNNYALFDKWNKDEIYFVTRINYLGASPRGIKII
ncbi:hypothetical protein LPB303_02710 [Polaribacter atrinae]|uniref:Transposase IS4-like domain-containing protein n=1 Tax=Polaribacter atrinae TaxID=1333662 RepID=A0A176TFC0_9FLAO|nr:hypothetical protein LPB303_02710 [Polaribacter atrinae]